MFKIFSLFAYFINFFKTRIKHKKQAKKQMVAKYCYCGLWSCTDLCFFSVQAHSAHVRSLISVRSLQVYMGTYKYIITRMQVGSIMNIKVLYSSVRYTLCLHMCSLFDLKTFRQSICYPMCSQSELFVNQPFRIN